MHLVSLFSSFWIAVQPTSAPAGIQLASQSPIEAALGRWALEDSSNCTVPNKAFTLSRVSGKIVWISDIGNTDVEAIVDVGDVDFRTITLTSSRVSGRSEPTGMNWTYTRIGPAYMKITRGGRETFLLARCLE